MSSAEDLEIYRQRYETFRHLDKLRWQMLQISIAAASIILAFGLNGTSRLEWWVLLVVGILLIVFGLVMERIHHGIRKNAEVLREFGLAIGDKSIPDVAHWWTSASFMVALLQIVLGSTCIYFAAYLYPLEA